MFYGNPEDAYACHPLGYASGLCEEWVNRKRRNSGMGAWRARSIQLHALAEASRMARYGPGREQWTHTR
jgi:hypothetical protein